MMFPNESGYEKPTNQKAGMFISFCPTTKPTLPFNDKNVMLVFIFLEFT